MPTSKRCKHVVTTWTIPSQCIRNKGHIQEHVAYNGEDGHYYTFTNANADPYHSKITDIDTIYVLMDDTGRVVSRHLTLTQAKQELLDIITSIVDTQPLTIRQESYIFTVE